VELFFFKALAVIVSFLYSVSQGQDQWGVQCSSPLIRDEGLGVTLDWPNSGKVISGLFSLSFAGETPLVEYECFRVADDSAHYQGNKVVMDCYRPQSWDEGFDILVMENPESGLRRVLVHELSFAGPILRGDLTCEGNWGPVPDVTGS